MHLNKLITAKEKALAKIMRYKQALFQNWKDKNITHNDYRHMSEDYERQYKNISAVIINMKTERSELEDGIDIGNPFYLLFKNMKISTNKENSDWVD